MVRLWESDDIKELLKDNGKDLLNLELQALIQPLGEQYGGGTQSETKKTQFRRNLG